MLRPLTQVRLCSDFPYNGAIDGRYANDAAPIYRTPPLPDPMPPLPDVPALTIPHRGSANAAVTSYFQLLTQASSSSATSSAAASALAPPRLLSSRAATSASTGAGAGAVAAADDSAAADVVVGGSSSAITANSSGAGASSQTLFPLGYASSPGPLGRDPGKKRGHAGIGRCTSASGISVFSVEVLLYEQETPCANFERPSLPRPPISSLDPGSMAGANWGSSMGSAVSLAGRLPSPPAALHGGVIGGSGGGGPVPGLVGPGAPVAGAAPGATFMLQLQVRARAPVHAVLRHPRALHVLITSACAITTPTRNRTAAGAAKPLPFDGGADADVGRQRDDDDEYEQRRCSRRSRGCGLRSSRRAHHRRVRLRRRAEGIAASCTDSA